MFRNGELLATTIVRTVGVTLQSSAHRHILREAFSDPFMKAPDFIISLLLYLSFPGLGIVVFP